MSDDSKKNPGKNILTAQSFCENSWLKQVLTEASAARNEWPTWTDVTAMATAITNEQPKQAQQEQRPKLKQNKIMNKNEFKHWAQGMKDAMAIYKQHITCKMVEDKIKSRMIK